MKNLKSYKLFESHKDNIKNEIQDILVDFSDNGIVVEVRHELYVFFVRIGTVFTNYRPEYNFSPMSYKDELMQLFSYMESEDYEFSTISYYDYNGVVHAFNKNNPDPLSTLFSIDETTNLKIFFKQKLSQ